MTENLTQRRLAGILVADVVGYSRLMEQDEAGTLAALTARRRQFFDPKIAGHGGRIFKAVGDGLLIEFASAVSAVECAVELQQAMTLANADLPAEKRMDFRIGVNIGDVLVQDGDVFGDGVNVAARLEGLAEPGGICVSASVYEQVKNKLKVRFDDLGFQVVKNITDPVRVYSVCLDQLEGPADLPGHKARLPLPAKPSIAVLPFDNMSGDPEQTYFSDGITEDIITDLSRFRGLFVIARNSSFVFRGKPVDAGVIGRRLGVQYLLEGSIRRSGERLRVTAQLVEAATGSHLWAERYDRKTEDLFDIQDDLTHTIVSTLVGRVEHAAWAVADRQRTDSMQAYDYLLQGIERHQRFTREDNEEARRLLGEAIRMDPEFALAHAWLGLSWMAAWDEDLDKAYHLASRAVAIDDNEGLCHVILGFACLYRRQYEKALAHSERAVDLNPNDGHALAHLGLVCSFTGQPEKAIELITSAIRHNPYHPHWYLGFLAYPLYSLGRYHEAALQMLRLPTRSIMQHAIASACAAQAGMMEEARRHVQSVLAENPQFSARQHAMSEPFANPDDVAHLLVGLLKAGLPE
jgi:TolB-like protein